MNVRRMDIHDLLVFEGAMEMTKAQYVRFGVSVPDWMVSGIKELGREIRSRQEDAMRLALERAERQYDAIKPTDMKRTELATEIERLKAALA
jgi:hypothetical protein